MAESSPFQTTLEPMSVRGVVRSACWNAGYRQWVTDDEADTMLWNFTGFPSFWDDDPVTCINRDIESLIRDGPGCPRCGSTPVPKDEFLCTSCRDILAEESP